MCSGVGDHQGARVIMDVAVTRKLNDEIAGLTDRLERGDITREQAIVAAADAIAGAAAAEVAGRQKFVDDMEAEFGLGSTTVQKAIDDFYAVVPPKRDGYLPRRRKT
jgi:hypothetical protein